MFFDTRMLTINSAISIFAFLKFPGSGLRWYQNHNKRIHLSNRKVHTRNLLSNQGIIFKARVGIPTSCHDLSQNSRYQNFKIRIKLNVKIWFLDKRHPSNATHPYMLNPFIVTFINNSSFKIQRLSFIDSKFRLEIKDNFLCTTLNMQNCKLSPLALIKDRHR